MPLTKDQQAEIDRQRGETATTRRAVSPGLEEVLYQPFPLLDHGFVRVIDYMGDDAAVVQAARVSYGRGTKKVSEDKAVIQHRKGLVQHLLHPRRNGTAGGCGFAALAVDLGLLVFGQGHENRAFI